MTQSLIILTPFADMSELAENFASRVDESHLMLPYSEAVAEEEWVHFVVQLADESPVISGQGRCTGSNDNGDEYPPEYRFDVVLDSLQFEGMSEVMFERILVARESQASGDPGTGEIDLEQMNAQAAEVSEVSEPAYEEASGVEAYADPGAVDFAEPSEAAYPAASALDAVPDAYDDEDEEDVPTQFGTALRPEDVVSPATVTQALDEEEPASAEEWADEAGDFDQPTQMGKIDAQTLEASKRSAPPPARPAPAPVAVAPVAVAPVAVAAAPAAPSGPRPTPRGKQRAAGALPLMHTFEEGVLTRPSLEASWVPTVLPRPEAAQSSGLFDYGGPIPRPDAPPRPDITDELRVVPAPSPSAPWSRAPEEVAAEI
jgi:hypothetical protein